MEAVLAKIDPIAFELGPIPVHWYGIIIASAMVLAVFLAVNEGQKRGIKEDTIYDLLLWGLPLALICARLYYVIFQWQYYRVYPSEIYRIWDGGIAIYGGLIGAFIVVLVLCKRQEISAWLMLDVVAPTVILAQGIGRWGNFVNQEAHGRATSRFFLQSLHLPEWIINQMRINGVYYQPTFLYESVWDILGFILLVSLRHRLHLFKQGEIFLAYLIWYALGRFFIEGMRTDSLMLGALRVSQWLSLLLFIGAIIVGVWRRRNDPALAWYLDAKD
ncbi:prolipoprotein diacylglyceryl transferase [Ligilactobacillus saerimneri]|uniref:prolipoprotein diacylglyceryl transferase n=1 Tax=Ligilactobacillus saerimneri TaxID=228229 RepID=UPI00242AAADF|nr:prolipoprotein diacylglyceryl transferase [Ligilactobacillus saerimneri]MDY4004155.1 prolipoprotein diacylglyceryl transferase [Ligilactobacillus saerimneri]